MNTTRENVLVTKGNLGLVPSGTPLYNTDGSLNIVVGQLGIFDAKTHKAITAATANTYPSIYFAVGVSTKNNGIADTVRKSSGENINGCAFDNASAEPPRGQCPEIWDFMFDCTTCEADYGIKITVESPEYWNEFGHTSFPTYNYNIVTDCCGCDQCTTSHNCQEIVCKFLDLINGVAENSGETKLNFAKKTVPFIAERLYKQIHKFTIPCLTENCGGQSLDAITSVTVSGVSLTGFVTSPNNSNVMLTGQISLLETQLNQKLKEAGFQGAFHVYKKCSDTCFEVSLNSCETLDAVSFATSPAPVIEIEEPLKKELTTNCKDCTDGGTEIKEYSCGIRLIAKMTENPCDCQFPSPEYNAVNFSKLKVYPTTGFGCQSFQVNQKQEVKISEGFGADLRYKEWKQDTGGVGRNYFPYMQQIGFPPAHIRNSRMNAVTAECRNYCQYNFRHRLATMHNNALGHIHQAVVNTLLAIPSDDTTTMTEFENFINPYMMSMNCPIGTVTCFEDKDQTVGELTV